MNKRAAPFLVLGGLVSHWVIAYFVAVFGGFWTSTSTINLIVGSFLLAQAAIAGVCLAGHRERLALSVAFGPVLLGFIALSVLGEVGRLLK